MLDSINGFVQNKDISFKFGTDTKNSSNSKTNSALDRLNSTVAKNTKSDTQRIVLVSKGESGYHPSFDIDKDGIVTLEEFNQYCSENGVSEEDKLKLISVLQNAKMVERLQEETKKAKEEAKDEPVSEKGKNIYARRGERKYDERMDENKDSLVTYEEYQKYCESVKSKDDKAKEDGENMENGQTPKEKEAKKAYFEPEYEPEISIETEA